MAQASESAAGQVIRQPGRHLDLWFDGKCSFPIKKTMISGKGRAWQMWPSYDTEGQTIPEALTDVTPLGKIPFVLMSKRYVNWFYQVSARRHICMSCWKSLAAAESVSVSDAKHHRLNQMRVQ